MKTKQQLTEENKALDLQNTVLSLALADLVNGTESKSFGGRKFRLTITRPTSACGGVVIVSAETFVGAYYFDTYARDCLAHIAAVITGEDNDHNRELIRRREIVETAQAWLRTRQSSAD